MNNDELSLEKKLEQLRKQHRALDIRIEQMLQNPYNDQLQIVRLKREKLALRDSILALEEELYPDIIA